MTDGTMQRPARRPTRIERTGQTRRDLFAAAAAVVGEIGYEAASINLITQKAGIANGTFYNYFASRQDLFDQLLPSVGEQLLEQITHAVEQGAGGLLRERKRFRAYFRFFAENPGFLRILNEAQIFAPRAYRDHLDRFVEGYARSLRRSLNRGEIDAFNEDELHTIAFMLMGARSYLSTLQSSGAFDHVRPKLDVMEDTYMKLIEHGLFRTATG
jgi:AcrR family transcriptional regulator